MLDSYQILNYYVHYDSRRELLAQTSYWDPHSVWRISFYWGVLWARSSCISTSTLKCESVSQAADRVKARIAGHRSGCCAYNCLLFYTWSSTCRSRMTCTAFSRHFFVRELFRCLRFEGLRIIEGHESATWDSILILYYDIVMQQRPPPSTSPTCALSGLHSEALLMTGWPKLSSSVL